MCVCVYMYIYTSQKPRNNQENKIWDLPRIDKRHETKSISIIRSVHYGQNPRNGKSLKGNQMFPGPEPGHQI